MNALTWRVVGSICGFFAASILRIGGQSDLKINLIAGIVGAIAAGIYMTPLFDETINQKGFSFHAGLAGKHGDNHMATGEFEAAEQQKLASNYSGLERNLPEKKGERGMYIPLSPFFSG